MDMSFLIYMIKLSINSYIFFSKVVKLSFLIPPFCLNKKLLISRIFRLNSFSAELSFLVFCGYKASNNLFLRLSLLINITLLDFSFISFTPKSKFLNMTA